MMDETQTWMLLVEVVERHTPNHMEACEMIQRAITGAGHTKASVMAMRQEYIEKANASSEQTETTPKKHAKPEKIEPAAKKHAKPATTEPAEKKHKASEAEQWLFGDRESSEEDAPELSQDSLFGNGVDSFFT